MVVWFPMLFSSLALRKAAAGRPPERVAIAPGAAPCTALVHGGRGALPRGTGRTTIVQVRARGGCLRGSLRAARPARSPLFFR